MNSFAGKKASQVTKLLKNGKINHKSKTKLKSSSIFDSESECHSNALSDSTKIDSTKRSKKEDFKKWQLQHSNNDCNFVKMNLNKKLDNPIIISPKKKLDKENKIDDIELSPQKFCPKSLMYNKLQLINKLKEKKINLNEGVKSKSQLCGNLKNSCKNFEESINKSSIKMSIKNKERTNLHFSLNTGKFSLTINNIIQQKLTKDLMNIQNEINQMQYDLNYTNNENNYLKDLNNKLAKELKDEQNQCVELSKNNNQLIEDKKEICTEIIIMQTKMKELKDKYDNNIKESIKTNNRLTTAIENN